jgi:FixJ family two-component response regulator
VASAQSACQLGGAEFVTKSDHIVFVVDDDPSFLRSVERLLRMAGYEVESFSSAYEFLQRSQPDVTACLVTDLRMPGMNGLDFQRELANTGWRIPIIFVTGHGDVSTSVRAMKAGAIEFLTKPFQEQEFLSAVSEALKRDSARRGLEADTAALRRRYDSLTPREREVMRCVVAGMPNKLIAANLEITAKTVKFHRAHIMAKMLAGSVAALVQMAIDLRLGANVS